MARVATPRTRTLLFVLVLLPLWSSYLARIYAWRLILTQDGALNWSLGKLGLPDTGLRLHEHGDVDRLLVHLAAVHDPPDLRGAGADPGLVHRGFARSGREGLDDVPASDPAARAPGNRGRLDLHVLADAWRLHHAYPRRQHDFIGNVIYRNVLGLPNNLPFAAAYATVPLVVMAIYLCWRKRTRRLRGPVVETRAARLRARCRGRCSSCCSCGFRSRSSASTRSTLQHPKLADLRLHAASGSAWRGTTQRRASALWLSVKAALAATAIALVLGTMAAFAIARFRFFGRDAVSLILVLPIALPGRHHRNRARAPSSPSARSPFRSGRS